MPSAGARTEREAAPTKAAGKVGDVEALGPRSRPSRVAFSPGGMRKLMACPINVFRRTRSCVGEMLGDAPALLCDLFGLLAVLLERSL